MLILANKVVAVTDKAFFMFLIIDKYFFLFMMRNK